MKRKSNFQTHYFNLRKKTKVSNSHPVSDPINVKDRISENEEKYLTSLVNKSKNNKEIYQEFPKLKYKNIFYQLNEDVLIQTDQTDDNLIGKITQIILIKISEKEYKALLRIRWYYKKDDLPKKYYSYFDCISDNEVFLTDHEDYVYVESINGKCQILNYEEYDQMEQSQDNIFFSRAKFNTSKNCIIEPPIESWPKACICKKPHNPDLLYIQCEKCGSWYHEECLDLPKEELESDFICAKCL